MLLWKCGDVLHHNHLNSDVIFEGYTLFGLVRHSEASNPSLTSITYLDSTMTEEEQEIRRKEIVNEVCEELFGEPANLCRSDVVGTVEAMLAAGYCRTGE